MDHDYLARLKQTHPALRLLNADNAPLIISFLFRIFIEPNRRSLPHSELVARLDDYLVQLRAMHGEERYPVPPVNTWRAGPVARPRFCASTTRISATSPSSI